MKHAHPYPKFWLAYFVVLLSGTVFDLLVEFARTVTGTASGSAIPGALFCVLALAPLYGYVRQRRVGARWLSISVFWICSVALVVSFGVLLFALSRNGFIAPVLTGLFFCTAGIPYLFAMHEYSFKSPHIWQHAA